VGDGGAFAVFGEDDEVSGEKGVVTVVVQLANGDKGLAGDAGEDVGLTGAKEEFREGAGDG
jgi:hypothetical protein